MATLNNTHKFATYYTDPRFLEGLAKGIIADCDAFGEITYAKDYSSVSIKFYTTDVCEDCGERGLIDSNTIHFDTSEVKGFIADNDSFIKVVLKPLANDLKEGWGLDIINEGLNDMTLGYCEDFGGVICPKCYSK